MRLLLCPALFASSRYGTFLVGHFGEACFKPLLEDLELVAKRHDLLVFDLHCELKFDDLVLRMIPITFKIVNDLVAGVHGFFRQLDILLLKQEALLV